MGYVLHYAQTHKIILIEPLITQFGIPLGNKVNILNKKEQRKKTFKISSFRAMSFVYMKLVAKDLLYCIQYILLISFSKI